MTFLRSLLLAVLGVLAIAPAASATTLVHVRTAALNVIADPAGSDVTAWWDGAVGQYVIHDPHGLAVDPTPAPAFDGKCVQLDATHIRCQRVFGDFDAFHVNFYGDVGDDEVRFGYGVPWHGLDASTILGGGGDDRLGGTPNHDQIYAGGGSDLVDGGAGSDTIVGFNSFLFPAWLPEMPSMPGTGPEPGPAGEDRLYGGPGSDFLVDEDELTAPGPDLLDGGSCAESEFCLAAPPAEAADDVDRVRYYRYANLAIRLDVPVGSGDANMLWGVDGDDRLVGAGDPGVGDELRCGLGTDRAEVDADDVTTDCETVTQPSAGGKPNKRCKPKQLARGRARCARPR